MKRLVWACGSLMTRGHAHARRCVVRVVRRRPRRARAWHPELVTPPRITAALASSGVIRAGRSIRPHWRRRGLGWTGCSCFARRRRRTRSGRWRNAWRAGGWGRRSRSRRRCRGSRPAACNWPPSGAAGSGCSCGPTPGQRPRTTPPPPAGWSNPPAANVPCNAGGFS